MGTSICNVTRGETSPLYIAIYSWSTLSTPHRLLQSTQWKRTSTSFSQHTTTWSFIYFSKSLRNINTMIAALPNAIEISR
jgi:hypothetical protein